MTSLYGCVHYWLVISARPNTGCGYTSHGGKVEMVTPGLRRRSSHVTSG